MDLRDTRFQSGNWMKIAQKKVLWRALVSAVLNCHILLQQQ